MGVLAKIDQVMPARLRKRASSLHSVTVSLPGAQDVPAADALMQIAGACRDQKKLTIDYADRAGAPRTYRPTLVPRGVGSGAQGLAHVPRRSHRPRHRDRRALHAAQAAARRREVRIAIDFL